MNSQTKTNTTTRNGNGYQHEPFTDDMRDELRSELRRELIEAKSENKVENQLLLRALTDQWSADQLRHVANRRGMNWRFLTALTDQILQVEGWAILSLVGTAKIAEMGESLLLKTFLILDRTDDLANKYDALDMLDGRRTHHLEAFKDFLERLNDQSLNVMFRRLGRLLSGGDDYDY